MDTRTIEAELDTRLGRVRLAITDGNHMYASAGYSRTSTEAGLRINGVRYALSLHLERVDGRWREVRDSNSSYHHEFFYSLRKIGDLNDRGPSDAARNKAAELLMPAILAWIGQRPDLLAEAESLRLELALKEVEGTLKELEGKIAAAALERTVILRKLGRPEPEARA